MKVQEKLLMFKNTFFFPYLLFKISIVLMQHNKAQHPVLDSAF